MGLDRIVMVRRLVGTVKQKIAKKKRQALISAYIKGGRKPWSAGYKLSRSEFIKSILSNDAVLAEFRALEPLPDDFGYGYDERVIEYPWVLARLDKPEGSLLDAGSALNHEYLLGHPALKNKKIVIYNLSPEKFIEHSNNSYIFGDLRHTILRDELFDEIVCISTLEHIGMNNTMLYSKDVRFNELKLNDYLIVLKEFKRLLKPGGMLLITVPYGRYENHGWLQQFDFKMVDAVFDAFGPSCSIAAYYKYFPDGWQIVKARECDDCSYFDIHNKPDYEPDCAAAARAVACIEMVK